MDFDLELEEEDDESESAVEKGGRGAYVFLNKKTICKNKMLLSLASLSRD